MDRAAVLDAVVRGFDVMNDAANRKLLRKTRSQSCQSPSQAWWIYEGKL
ncbi:hypothetical protein [Dyella sp. GSA-30]|nr:hypothetical protein [Dyella sp. GSA-30]